jgi:hypothetical protein
MRESATLCLSVIEGVTFYIFDFIMLSGNFEQ